MFGGRIWLQSDHENPNDNCNRVIAPFAGLGDEPGPVGRYVLLYAVTEFEKIGAGPGVEEKSLWKIGTVTGQVWRYVNIADGKTIKEGFVPIETRGP